MTERRDKGIQLTPEQARHRRARSVAIGLAIGLLVLVFYAMTIAKLGLHLGAGAP